MQDRRKKWCLRWMKVVTMSYIAIEDENVELVKEFVYLGRMFTKDGNICNLNNPNTGHFAKWT